MTRDSFEGTIAGQRFKFNGRESIYLVITAGCLTAVGWMLWNSTQGMKRDLADQTVVITNQHQEISRQHESLQHAIEGMNETLQEQNYIITLPADRRERLNLSMPRSLREKIRTGN